MRAPPLRRRAPVAATAAAIAAAVFVAFVAVPPLRVLTPFGLATADGRAGADGAAATTIDNGDGDGDGGGLPPPWGTRPAVPGGDTRCYLVGPTMDAPDGPMRPRGSAMEVVHRLWANGSRAYCVTGPVCFSPAAAGASGPREAAATALTLFSPSVSCHSVDAAGRPVRPAHVPPSPSSLRTSTAESVPSSAGTEGEGGGAAAGTVDYDDGDVDSGGDGDGGGWEDPLADAGACAYFRARHVWRKYGGKEGAVATAAPDAAGVAGVVGSQVSASGGKTHLPPPPARWHDGLTVVVPPYAHSEKNLCHWLRGWVMVSHALHHLAQYVPPETAVAAAVARAVRAAAVAAGAVTAAPPGGDDANDPAAARPATDKPPDGRPFPTAAIYFVSPAVFDSPWNRGVMRASLAAVAAAGGPRSVGVANAHPGDGGGVECFRRAVLPGVDGSFTDAHTWGSDAPVVAPAVAAADAHVPAVPREALALREAVYAAAGLPPTVHPDDTLRLHPPAAGVVSAAAAAGLPTWPAAWAPETATDGAVNRPQEPPWPSSLTRPPHPWATVRALFASAATSPAAGRPAPPPAAGGAPPPSAEGDTLRLAVPPRSILVLSRAPSSKRHFDDDSAAAFAAIIRDAARTRGLTLLTVALDELSALDVQVGVARRAGLVIGIHGANLVNCAWVPAGGALIELIPHGYRWTSWYEAGGNAGLRYSAVGTSPTGQVLPCDAPGHQRRCIDNDLRDVTLVLDGAARRAFRGRLGRAIDYLDALWAANPDGWMTVRGEGAVYRLPDLN